MGQTGSKEKSRIKGGPRTQSTTLPGANLVDLVTDDSWCWDTSSVPVALRGAEVEGGLCLQLT